MGLSGDAKEEEKINYIIKKEKSIKTECEYFLEFESIYLNNIHKYVYALELIPFRQYHLLTHSTRVCILTRNRISVRISWSLDGPLLVKIP